MKKLIMTGRVILNCLDEQDKIIHEDCCTDVNLYLEDDELCQMELTLNFPSAGINKKAEFYFWGHYRHASNIIVSVYESAIKISEDELVIQFRLFDENNGDTIKFSGIARLRGVIPTLISTGSLFDLSTPHKPFPQNNGESSLLINDNCMRGMIQLNYIFDYPQVLSSSKGECELCSDMANNYFLRFPYSFPEFQINDSETIPINDIDFQGEGYIATWFICVQLSENELLIGFTIFEDRDTYPNTIGGFARLRGEIPSKIHRKVLI